MPKYSIVLFDFDGTLVESGSGILLSMRRMLADMGRDPLPQEELNRFIGPPLAQSFSEMLGFEGEELARALESYRMWQEKEGMAMLHAYDGVLAMLRALRDAGVYTAIATCKVEATARKHAKATGIENLVDDIVGLCPEEGRTGKADVLRCLLARCHARPEDAVLVGDRMYDCEGAQEVGMPCIGVLYGFGSEQELAAYHPIALVNSPLELQNLLLQD